MPDQKETREEKVLRFCKDLLECSQKAWESASVRDFAQLASAMERRSKIIDGLKAQGDLRLLSQATTETARESFLSVTRIDEEIAKVLRHEMASDQRMIQDIASKARALSAYGRVLHSDRNFDRCK